MTNHHDEKLRPLLRQWKELEPGPTFESNVWRRIQLPGEKPIPQPGLGEWLAWLFRQPVRAALVAAVAGLVIGLSAGWPGLRVSTPDVTLALNRPGTISGSYLQLMSGGH